MNIRASQRGLTLMELLKTVGIVAVVLSFGVPSMTSLVRNNQSVTYTNEIISTMHAARSLAVQNVVQVTVCKSKDQVRCAAGASWNDGWIAFADRDEDEIRDLDDANEELIYAHPALDDSYTLQSAAYSDWIAFRSNGRPIGSAANSGTFLLCNESDADYNRAVEVGRMGSPSTVEFEKGACK